MKKALIVLLVLILLWAGGYVYRSSMQKPNDNIATDTTPTQTATTPAPAEENTNNVANPENTKSYSVVQGSTINWKATKVGGEHFGTVPVTDGFLSVNDKKIVGGMFTLNMQGIELLDIENEKFENEIKNDFYEAEKFPISKFTITKTEFDGVKTMIFGDLTIKDKTVAIQFPATVQYEENQVRAVASFAIDRQLWGLTMWEWIVNNYLQFEIDLTRTPAL